MNKIASFFNFFLKSRYFLIFLFIFGFILRFQTYFHELYNGDETNYAAHAMILEKGGTPYVGFVEKKPPLIYFFYTISFKIFGSDLRFVHFLTYLWIFLGTIFLFFLLKRKFGADIAKIGAIFYIIATSSFIETEIFATNCEILMLTPLLIGLFFYFQDEKKVLGLFLSGFFSSLGFLFKHQAGIFIVAVFFHILFCEVLKEKTPFAVRLKKNAKYFFLHFLGFIVPIALVVGFYIKLGHLKELYEWNILQNFVYIQKTQVPLAYSLSKGFLNSLGFVGSNLALFYLVISFLRKKKEWSYFFSPDQSRFIVFSLFWFVFSFVPIMMGGRFYGHYFIQLYPPLVILASIGFFLLLKKPLHFFQKFVLVLGLIFIPLFFQFFSLGRTLKGGFDGALSYHQAIAKNIQELTEEDDSIFVWGGYSQAYYFSKRIPATRFVVVKYVFPFWEMSYSKNYDFSFEKMDPVYQENFSLLMSDLIQKKPALVLDTSSSSHFLSFQPFPIRSFPPLETWLEDNYELVRTIEGVSFYFIKKR